jgi:hypothetical protein
LVAANISEKDWREMGVNETKAKAEAVRRADALLDASASLRRELVKYERELRRARTRVLNGKPNPSPHILPDLVAVRLRLNKCFDELERCRRRWRVAFFRLQTDAGMSLGAIAREWSLSRQLVSRLMSDETAQTNTRAHA